MRDSSTLSRTNLQVHLPPTRTSLEGDRRADIKKKDFWFEHYNSHHQHQLNDFHILHAQSSRVFLIYINHGKDFPALKSAGTL